MRDRPIGGCARMGCCRFISLICLFFCACLWICIYVCRCVVPFRPVIGISSTIMEKIRYIYFIGVTSEMKNNRMLWKKK